MKTTILHGSRNIWYKNLAGVTVLRTATGAYLSAFKEAMTEDHSFLGAVVM